MEELTKKLLKIKNNKFDIILTDDFLKMNASTYRSTIDFLSKKFHKLFDNVDWDLKMNLQLNDEINSLVQMKEILNFDIKKYFTKIDKDGNEYFSKEWYDKMVTFVNNWKYDELKFQVELQKLSSKKIFKSYYKKKANKLNSEITNNNRTYKMYKDIFDKQNAISEMDLGKINQTYNEKLENVNSCIYKTMDKYIEQSLLKNPDLILYGKILENIHEKENIQSSAFLSNDINKNLSQYFNGSMLLNRLNYICDDYKKERILEKSQKVSEKTSKENKLKEKQEISELEK